MIWERAEEMFTKDFYDSHEENVTQPTRAELREGGYFYNAKCAVLRDINRAKSGGGIDPDDFTPPTREEWEATRTIPIMENR